MSCAANSTLTPPPSNNPLQTHTDTLTWQLPVLLLYAPASSPLLSSCNVLRHMRCWYFSKLVPSLPQPPPPIHADTLTYLAAASAALYAPRFLPSAEAVTTSTRLPSPQPHHHGQCGVDYRLMCWPTPCPLPTPHTLLPLVLPLCAPASSPLLKQLPPPEARELSGTPPAEQHQPIRHRIARSDISSTLGCLEHLGTRWNVATAAQSHTFSS